MITTKILPGYRGAEPMGTIGIGANETIAFKFIPAQPPQRKEGEGPLTSRVTIQPAAGTLSISWAIDRTAGRIPLGRNSCGDSTRATGVQGVYFSTTPKRNWCAVKEDVEYWFNVKNHGPATSIVVTVQSS